MIHSVTKKDRILIIIVLLIAAIFVISHRITDTSEKKQVLVRVDGELVSQTDLSEDQTIMIENGSNIIKIEHNQVYMQEADCPDHLCMKQGVISRNHESIICLPNKVVVEIKSVDEEDFDIVAK